MIAPDYAEPIIGWRVWRVSDGRSGLLLRSAVYDRDWLPREPLTASCTAGHAAPDTGCSCGIYAARELEAVRRYLVGRDDPWIVGRVVGRVALWGVVVEGPRGWRAARAYPVELRVSGGVEPAGRIAAGLRRYGVPVLREERFMPGAHDLRGRRRLRQSSRAHSPCPSAVRPVRENPRLR